MDGHRKVNPWIVAIAVMFATFMEVLDTTVVNVSLPHIAGNLSATIDESTWVLTSYLVANAIILPLTGWLASYFGRKRLLMASVTGFTLSSLLCGLAPNLPLLVMFRLLQGATGGCMQPLSQAVLLEAFPPHERGKAMGFWGLGIVVAPILGPVLGGWLTDSYSWRWVFYINLPVGIASLVMTKLYVFDPPYLERDTTRIDYWGIGLLVLWVGTLQLALDLGQSRDWFSSPFIITLVVLSGGGVVAFLAREWLVKEPVIDLRVFKIRTYATGVFLMTTLGFVLYGSLVLLPIMLQTLLGYPSLQAGMAMAPRGLGSLIGMPIGGPDRGQDGCAQARGRRVDHRRRHAVLARPAQPRRRLLGHLLAAVRPGPGAVADLRAAHDHQHGCDSARAHGQRDQSLQPDAQSRRQHRHRRDGHAARAQTAGLHQHARQPRRRVLAARTTDARTVAAGIHGGGHRSRHGRATGLWAMFGMVQRQAAMLSFVDLFRLLGVMFLLLLPLILLMKRPRQAAAPGGAH